MNPIKVSKKKDELYYISIRDNGNNRTLLISIGYFNCNAVTNAIYGLRKIMSNNKSYHIMYRFGKPRIVIIAPNGQIIAQTVLRPCIDLEKDLAYLKALFI